MTATSGPAGGSTPLVAGLLIGGLMLMLLVGGGAWLAFGWISSVRAAEARRAAVAAEWQVVTHWTGENDADADDRRAFEPVAARLASLEMLPASRNPVGEERTVAFADLPNDWQRFFEALRAWHAQGRDGGWPRPEANGVDELAIALDTVPTVFWRLRDPAAEDLAAILHLAAVARRGGDSFALSSGQRVDSVLRSWLQAVAPYRLADPAFARWRPDPADVFPALCRDALAHAAKLAFDPDRQVAAQELWIDLLRDLERHRDDLPAMIRRMQQADTPDAPEAALEAFRPSAERLEHLQRQFERLRQDTPR